MSGAGTDTPAVSLEGPPAGSPDGPSRGGAWRGRETAAWICLGALLLALGLACASGWDGTETRRAAIAREMLHSGDWIVPRLGGEITLTKPPLHYWLVAASMALFGENVAASRLPAALLHALLVPFVFFVGLRYGRRHLGRDARYPYALAGAVLVALHPILLSFAASAEIDGVFASFGAFALLTLLLAMDAPGRRRWLLALLAGLWAGLALLAKGPPIWLGFVPALIAAVPMLRPGPALAALAVHFVPSGVWILLLRLRERATELAQTGALESVGRTSYFRLEDLLELPVDLVSLTLLTLPLLLVLLFVDRRGAGRPARRHWRPLLWAGLGSLYLLAFFPHRATRYALPGVLPLLVWLAHVPSAWLEGRAAGLDRTRHVAAAFFALLALGLLLVGPPWLLTTPWALLLGALLLTRVRGLLGILLALSVLITAAEVLDRRYRDGLAPKGEWALAREIEARTGADVVTLWGHVPTSVIWELGARADSHEFPGRGRAVRGRWIVLESGLAADVPEGFVLRWRGARTHDEILLFERER